jgi:hypothetical protein
MDDRNPRIIDSGREGGTFSLEDFKPRRVVRDETDADDGSDWPLVEVSFAKDGLVIGEWDGAHTRVRNRRGEDVATY